MIPQPPLPEGPVHSRSGRLRVAAGPTEAQPCPPAADERGEEEGAAGDPPGRAREVGEAIRGRPEILQEGEDGLQSTVAQQRELLQVDPGGRERHR